MAVAPINALTQGDLDEMHCVNPECPGCDAISLYAACHPGKGLKVTYTHRNGVLHVTCVVCGSVLAIIEVAP